MRLVKRKRIERTRKAGKECQGCGREIAKHEGATEIVYVEDGRRAWSEYYCHCCKAP